MMFILAGPDSARMVEEFGAIHDPPPYSAGHHGDGRGLQATFRKDISYFVKVVGQLGNPFIATSLELVRSTRYSECYGRVCCGITF